MRGEHVPETEQFGISSFVYRARRPFHPERLWNLIGDGGFSGVLRSKGLFYLASRMDDVQEWSQAGEYLHIEDAGGWQEDSDGQDSETDWDPEYGYRRQEIVFIGMKMDQEEICRELDGCLLNEKELELEPKDWMTFSDPFPSPSEEPMEAE